MNLLSETLNSFNKVGILVNNAGIGIVKPTLELSEEEREKVIKVNLTGVFLCSKLVDRRGYE